MYAELNGVIRGILNDFDLASVMEPGIRFPEKIGWERTGTLPFLAIPLLEFRGGLVKRWYKYDLESFAWCLLWHMLRTRSPAWLSEDHETVHEHKNVLLCVDKLEEYLPEEAKREWTPYFGIIMTWFGLLEVAKGENAAFVRIGRNKLKKLLTPGEKALMHNELEDTRKDIQHIRPVVSFAKTMTQSQEVEALRDITWIKIHLEKEH